MTCFNVCPCADLWQVLSGVHTNPSDVKSSQSASPCSLEYRRRKVSEYCRQTSSRGRPHIALSLIGGNYRLFYCTVCKAGVFSARDFYGGLNTNPLYRGRAAVWNWQPRRGEGEAVFKSPGAIRGHLADSGIDWSQFNMVWRFPVQSVLSRFADYRKLMIVRHPLQRLVAAYYQRVVTNGHPQNPMPLEEFVRRRVLQERSPDPHWLDVEGFCSLCEIQYDYILKLETLDKDLPAVHSAIGIDPNLTYPTAHINKRDGHISEGSSIQKYDNQLRSLQTEYPELFQRLLLKYQVDMELFGYTWTNQSGCWDPNEHCC